MDLTGRVAVVTGAASGIGLALAHELATAGCRLSLADIDAAALYRAGKSLETDGFDVMTTPTDVGHLPDVEHLAGETLARFGAAHIVVNNAGVIAWNPVDALTIGDWRWVVDVNIWGVIHGIHVFLPLLERQATEGHFVNLSSVGGVLADVPYMATYSATKAAVIGLSLTLATELRLANQSIGVTIVCPSATRDTHAHEAERSRPASAGTTERTQQAQALLDVVAEQISEGQPLASLTSRVLDAIRHNELWAFPDPDSAQMLQPRLDALSSVLRAASA